MSPRLGQQWLRRQGDRSGPVLVPPAPSGHASRCRTGKSLMKSRRFITAYKARTEHRSGSTLHREGWPMSALGQKRTCAVHPRRSATECLLPPAISAWKAIVSKKLNAPYRSGPA